MKLTSEWKYNLHGFAFFFIVPPLLGVAFAIGGNFSNRVRMPAFLMLMIPVLYWLSNNWAIIETFSLWSGQVTSVKKSRTKTIERMKLEGPVNVIIDGVEVNKGHEPEHIDDLNKCLLGYIDERVDAYRTALCEKHGVPEHIYKRTMVSG